MEDHRKFLEWAKKNGHERKTIQAGYGHYDLRQERNVELSNACFSLAKVFDFQYEYLDENNIGERLDTSKELFISTLKKVRDILSERKIEVISVSADIDEYDETCIHMKVKRPETDDEFAHRLRKPFETERQAINRRENLIKELEKLEKTVSDLDKVHERIDKIKKELNT